MFLEQIRQIARSGQSRGLWLICEHYKLPITDRRILDMTDEQVAWFAANLEEDAQPSGDENGAMYADEDYAEWEAEAAAEDEIGPNPKLAAGDEWEDVEL